MKCRFSLVQMKNPKVYGFEITFEKTEGKINTGQSRDTGNIWAHKTQDKDKQSTKTQHNTEINYKYEQQQKPG